jgi:hypothetical protein
MDRREAGEGLTGGHQSPKSQVVLYSDAVACSNAPRHPVDFSPSSRAASANPHGQTTPGAPGVGYPPCLCVPGSVNRQQQRAADRASARADAAHDAVIRGRGEKRHAGRAAMRMPGAGLIGMRPWWRNNVALREDLEEVRAAATSGVAPTAVTIPTMLAGGGSTAGGSVPRPARCLLQHRCNVSNLWKSTGLCACATRGSVRVCVRTCQTRGAGQRARGARAGVHAALLLHTPTAHSTACS